MSHAGDQRRGAVLSGVLGDAFDALPTEGLDVGNDAIAHLTPAQHDHINSPTARTPSTSTPNSGAKVAGATPHRLTVRQVHENNQIGFVAEPTPNGHNPSPD